ncbi:hypothetical protein BHM03_00033057, partial [Ensete ventricosum]
MVASTWTARYWAVPPNINRRRSISAVEGRLSEKKGRSRRGKRRKKRKEDKKEYLSLTRGPRPCAVAASGSPALFLQHEEKDRGD